MTTNLVYDFLTAVKVSIKEEECVAFKNFKIRYKAIYENCLAVLYAEHGLHTCGLCSQSDIDAKKNLEKEVDEFNKTFEYQNVSFCDYEDFDVWRQNWENKKSLKNLCDDVKKRISNNLNTFLEDELSEY